MVQKAVPTRHSPFDSLATRVIFVVFLGTFLVAAAVSWITVDSTFEVLRGQLDRQLPVRAAELGDGLSTWLAVERDALAERARSPALTRSLREPLAARAAHALEATLAESSLGGLAVVDSRGTRRVAVGSASRLLPETGLAPLPHSVALPDGGHLPLVAAPLEAREGLLLVGVIDRQTLSKRLAFDLPHAGEEVHLLTADDRLAWTSGTRAPGEVAPRPSASAGPTDVYRGVSGGFVVGAVVPVAALGWTLLVEHPFRTAFAPVFAVVTRIFLIDLGMVLLFSVLAYKVTTAIVRPIEALSEGARRISQGQLEVEIPEPRGHDELGLLTRTFNDMTHKLIRSQDQVHETNARLTAQNAELQSANEVLEQLSITDGLTKLHNHRYFQDFLTREIKRVSRSEEPLSMLLMDIDDFKHLNDRLGHAAGDELLVNLAGIVNDAVRETDLLARYGGEEFVVLAPDTDLEGAVNLAEKIRTSIAESSFILDDSKQLSKMTVSVGVAQFGGSRKSFFNEADQALYRAKAAGKNCVVAEDDRDAPGEADLPGA